MYETFEELCEIYGVTPYKVSQETGISRPTLSNWKNGRFNLKLENLQKIADYFGVSVNVFFGEESPECTEEEIRDKHQSHQLVNDFLKLDIDDRRIVLMLVQGMLNNKKYEVKDGK